MFQEQCRLLETLKKEIRDSKAAMEMMDLTQADVVADIMKKTILERFVYPKVFRQWHDLGIDLSIRYAISF